MLTMNFRWRFAAFVLAELPLEAGASAETYIIIRMKINGW